MKGAVKIPVIGGRAGRPWRRPNPAVKRGWSQTKAYWKFDPPAPAVVWIVAERYVLREENGKQFYLHVPTPELRAEIIRQLGWPSG